MSVRVTVAVLGVMTMAIASVGSANPPVCDGAMALRVNQKGLDFVVEMVKPMVPNTLDIPAISQVIVDWPLIEADATAHVPPVKVSINLQKLLVQMDGGAVRVQGQADVTGGTTITVENPYVGLGSTECVADVALRDLSIDLSMSIGTQGGDISAQVNHAKISFSNDKTVVGLKGCALGSIVTKVVDFVRKHFMSTVEKLLEKVAKEKIATLVSDKLGQTFELTKEVKGYVFTGRLEAINTDAAGLSVGLGVGVGPKQETAPSCLAGVNLTSAPTCSGVPVHLSAQTGAMFGAGLSEALINQALHTVWRGGMLCLTSGDPKLATLAQGLDKLGGVLGQPQGTELSFGMRMLTAPRVRTSVQGGLELVLEKVHLKLNLDPPAGPPGEVTVVAGLVVGGVPWIDPVSNSVTLDLKKVAVSQLELLGKGGAPSQLKLDPARLQRFISTVAMPVLQERLSGLPLSASVIAVQGLQVELKSFQVKDGFIAAYVDAHQLKPTGDKGSPDTLLKEGPSPEVGPQVIRLTVAGNDNYTPPALLQFKARIDGGPWTEPKYGGKVDVAVHGGAHVVEVAAIDHDGNIDPTPIMLKFIVDDVMPQLMITSRPDSLVHDGTINVAFTGRDDRTTPEKLRFKVDLLRVPDAGGMPEVVQTVDVPSSIGEARFDDLPDGVYKARVIVSDGVGNVTSEDVGFVVATESGCSYSARGGNTAGAPFLLLALLSLMVVRRRTV